MRDRGSSALYVGLLLIGAVVGILLLGGLRFVAQPPHEHVHYHANWALFVNGERLDLTGDRYMEDVFQCMADPNAQRPQDRVHMHENNHDVVHVHDSGATWGHLLGNLGFAVGDDFLYTHNRRFDSGEDGNLKFILNGQPVRSIRNLPIQNRDRLLISFGPEPVEEATGTQFQSVANDAGEYNTMPDPASCAGAVEESIGDRLRRAFWF